MKHRFRLASSALLAPVLLTASPVGAAPWEAEAGDLGRIAHRFAIHIGGTYGVLSGSEVSKADPGVGFEGALSYRVLRSLSVYGGYAWHSADVAGQLRELLDVAVRPDGRSGKVSGSIKSSRLRAGVRVDAYRAEDWEFQTYLVGGALYAMVDATVDTVDGAPPVRYELPDGSVVDPGSISDNTWGAFGRLGVEYFFARDLAVDVNFSFEILDSPSGTKDLSSFTGGIVYRL